MEDYVTMIKNIRKRDRLFKKNKKIMKGLLFKPTQLQVEIKEREVDAAFSLSLSIFHAGSETIERVYYKDMEGNKNTIFSLSEEHIYINKKVDGINKFFEIHEPGLLDVKTLKGISKNCFVVKDLKGNSYMYADGLVKLDYPYEKYISLDKDCIIYEESQDEKYILNGIKIERDEKNSSVVVHDQNGKITLESTEIKRLNDKVYLVSSIEESNNKLRFNLNTGLLKVYLSAGITYSKENVICLKINDRSQISAKEYIYVENTGECMEVKNASTIASQIDFSKIDTVQILRIEDIEYWYVAGYLVRNENVLGSKFNDEKHVKAIMNKLNQRELKVCSHSEAEDLVTDARLELLVDEDVITCSQKEDIKKLLKIQ